MDLIKRICTTMFLTTLTAGTAVAGECGYEKCWGAVAVGNGGSYGWAADHRSENSAISGALSECPGSCDVVRSFYNACGSIAEADNGAWGFGWSSSRNAAESEAMSYCMDGGLNCQVRVWACSK